MKIVEATILIPMTIIIIVSIIGLMMTCYEDLGKQIESHSEMRAGIYEKESVW